eukprot:346501-Alexandrium_andersonii.AAC.1
MCTTCNAIQRLTHPARHGGMMGWSYRECEHAYTAQTGRPLHFRTRPFQGKSSYGGSPTGGRGGT